MENTSPPAGRSTLTPSSERVQSSVEILDEEHSLAEDDELSESEEEILDEELPLAEDDELSESEEEILDEELPLAEDDELSESEEEVLLSQAAKKRLTTKAAENAKNFFIFSPDN